MKATTRRGGAGGLAAKKKTKKAPARGFMCGCGGTKSVATVSCAAAANISAVTTTPMKPTAAAKAASATKTTAAAVPGPVSRDADVDDADASAEGTPTVDALLWQLRELERGVRALGVREDATAAATPRGRPPRHRRSATDCGGGGRRLEAESVAVVTESDDPLGDFRRSMVQMIVENGITGGAELRELLQRFLSLNSARHHHLILRAFADVWEELFAGGARAPPPPAAEAPYYSSRTSCKRPHSRADTLTTVA
ncbi:hypothetical protein ACP70R_017033 [Stipagrostis hirtigluma subsp. patula]